MRFTIDRETFYKALQKIQGIVEKRNTMPILANALIEADGESISVIATDLEVGMKSSYPAQIHQPGKITVSAKKLYEIIKELPDQQITFSTKENDWVEIKCGKAVFNLVGLSPEEFPYFPDVTNGTFIELHTDLLREMIEKTAYAICMDETKYNLNGVFIQAVEEDGKPVLKMVSTDGHRLSLCGKECAGAAVPELAKGVIFPKKGVFELRKLAEEEVGTIQLGFMDNSAAIRKGNTVVVMRLVDGEFPDYRRVIPSANNRVVSVGKDNFLHCLRRMSILSSDKFKGIRLEIRDGVMEISSNNPELGEAREEVEVSFEGDPLVLRFNARYIIDVLSVITTDTAEIGLKDELSPAILRSGSSSDFLAVIMPMRL